MELADRPCEAFDRRRSRARRCSWPLEQHAAQFVAGAEELGRSLGNTGLDPHYVRALLSEEEATQLNVDDTFLQLGDFAENLQHQVQSLVVEPLREYGANLAEARRQAAKFDDESAELDAATLKYLSLSRESPLETRAVAQQDLSDRVAQTALQLFDTQMALKDGCGCSAACRSALGEPSSRSSRTISRVRAFSPGSCRRCRPSSRRPTARRRSRRSSRPTRCAPSCRAAAPRRGLDAGGGLAAQGHVFAGERYERGRGHRR